MPSVLYEELARTGFPATQPKFLLWNRWCPAPGKGAELRGVIEERIRKGPPPGAAAVILSQQVASVDGPAFGVNVLFPSMAAIDELRAATAKDPDSQAYFNRLGALCRIPVQQRMQRILVPFPAV